MPTSFSNITPANMELSPVRVTYKGVDLGGTLKNATVNWTFPKAEIKADQQGDTPLTRRVKGLLIDINTEIAEVVNKANWKVVFPHLNLVGGGSAAQFVSKIGDDDVANAGILLLHPLSLPDADHSRDHTFYLATADATSTIIYGPGDQATLKIKWNVYPDFSVGTQPRFSFYGDTTVGLVSATAGAPAFTGTGNGTITLISVFNGFTKTETITVKCVGASTGNDFYVSGSLSGALGEFHVGSASGNSFAFVSSVIAFTLTQGTTQFVFGDFFTIATTAANYV